MNKIESIIKKLKNFNVKGLLEGRHNLTTGEMELLAASRAAVCARCPSNIQEPIAEMAIEDKKLPDISERCCKECGCALPYLVRQTAKTCSLKKWEI